VTIVLKERRWLYTAVGWLDCCVRQGAVTGIDFVDGPGAVEVGTERDSAVLDDLERQLRDYFEGSRRTFDLPLQLLGTPFQQQAWDVLRGIGFGHTITYGEQAQRMGRPTAVRAVGGANSRNPVPIVVPCHRVIGASGRLVGFAGGLDRKMLLLEHERLMLGG
jgi:methylated-DNA-[protein]-cysteine S-methyltransferase